MKQAVFVLQFGFEYDERAMRFFEHVIPGRNVLRVISAEIVEDGVVLNCVQWYVSMSLNKRVGNENKVLIPPL